MIARDLQSKLEYFIDNYPAVALLGPRQAGKTTLAVTIDKHRHSIYLDLESEQDRAKLNQAEFHLHLLDEFNFIQELAIFYSPKKMEQNPKHRELFVKQLVGSTPLKEKANENLLPIFHPEI